MRKILFTMMMGFIAFPVFAQNQIQNEQEWIIGTWLSETDPNWKLVFFTNGTCVQYYGSQILEMDNYFISNTTPQCEENVLVDDKTSYLMLTNQETAEEECYEVYGITDEYLNIRPIHKGGFMIFVRQ